MKNEVNVGDLTPQQRLELARGNKAAPVGEREAFEAWTRKEYAFDDDMLRKSNEGHYSYAKPANMWDAYQAGAAHQRQQAREVVMPSAEILADLFVGCPLPKTVRVDECALAPDYPHRFGTNLLTWGEARLMFGEMLARLNKGAGSHE